MSLELCQIIWYLVIGVSVILYIVLDGFDLGVGCLHLFTKGDHERRLMLNAIGPVWDGNEVWLIIVFGALFVGFPPVYGTICSAFYLLIMILLMGLMMRAVAIEFRSKQPSKRWRQFWDILFSLGSYLIAFTIGVLMGNIISGIPIDGEEVFHGTFLGFFTPFSMLIGLFGISVFMMHGAIFMLMKTEGKMHERVKSFVKPTLALFLILYLVTTLVTFISKPHDRFDEALSALISLWHLYDGSDCHHSLPCLPWKGWACLSLLFNQHCASLYTLWHWHLSRHGALLSRSSLHFNPFQ